MPPTPNVLSFKDALADSANYAGERSVLLGNGFGIAWDRETFHYESLFDEAKLKNLTVDKVALFDGIDTHDFERVIEHLQTAARLAKLYATSDPDLAKRLAADAKVVRRGLADVLAARHPESSAKLLPAECLNARHFLSRFRRIYSVNYDLLLYWVVNMQDVGHDVVRGDGFQFPT